ncbi:hypothetical protein YC2023_081774 [Brassica napus]
MASSRLFAVHITSNIPALSLSTTSGGRRRSGFSKVSLDLSCLLLSICPRLASLVSCYCCTVLVWRQVLFCAGAETVWSEFSDNFNPFFGRLVFRGAVH